MPPTVLVREALSRLRLALNDEISPEIEHLDPTNQARGGAKYSTQTLITALNDAQAEYSEKHADDFVKTKNIVIESDTTIYILPPDYKQWIRFVMGGATEYEIKVVSPAHAPLNDTTTYYVTIQANPPQPTFTIFNAPTGETLYLTYYFWLPKLINLDDPILINDYNAINGMILLAARNIEAYHGEINEAILVRSREVENLYKDRGSRTRSPMRMRSAKERSGLYAIGRKRNNEL